MIASVPYQAVVFYKGKVERYLANLSQDTYLLVLHTRAIGFFDAKTLQNE